MSVELQLPKARAALAGLRNKDTGWGYAAGKASRLEPTCWALLATAPAGQPPDIQVLLQWKRQDGWLIDLPGAPVNYAFNAIAALTLRMHASGTDEARRIAARLLEVRGIKLGQGPEIRQDNSLQAWPWIDSTFSWVEPTSWCLLLMKQLWRDLPLAPVKSRIDVGERMLADRSCAAGGWNYGGSNVYGQELFPYVPTTALGLLALQDRPADPTVTRALHWITKEAGSEPSTYALALAVIATGACRAPVPALGAALSRQLESGAGTLGVMALAAGLYALSPSPNGRTAFTL